MITVEVNKQQEENKDEQPKDIFFQGNYVQGTITGLVLLVTESNGDIFSGVIIKGAIDDDSNGFYCQHIDKRYYIQFTGTITITSK